MSPWGYNGGCRLIDLTNTENCFDKINRSRFYKYLINNLIEEGEPISPFKSNDVTNTLHDNIVKYFLNKNQEIYMLEIPKELFEI